MKRKPVIAANWKMYKTKDEALAFVFTVNQKIPTKEEVESIVFAPSILLNLLVKREGEELRIGAQNMHYADEGAYTGENSPLQVKTAGAEYILIGHSERRRYYNETDEDVNLKLHAALRHGLIPVVCVGESLDVRNSKGTKSYIQNQIDKALEHVDQRYISRIIFAYEPLWAIGTGKTATPVQANKEARHIREKIAALYNKDVAEEIRVLYGGSVTTSNIESLLKETYIDGALIGGAALDPVNFIEFTQIASKF